MYQFANRPEDKLVPSHYSRHYYDLFRMGHSAIKKSAFMNKDLLEKVALFKEKFYPCSYAKYDDAKIGTLRLTPPSHTITDLKTDYAKMAEMIYGVTPCFDEVLRYIGELEKEINEL